MRLLDTADHPVEVRDEDIVEAKRLLRCLDPAAVERLPVVLGVLLGTMPDLDPQRSIAQVSNALFLMQALLARRRRGH